MSGLSNQSHDSQASSSTASANSQDEKRGVHSTGVEINDGQGQEEEELDEMEVEYTEVCMKYVQHILNVTVTSNVQVQATVKIMFWFWSPDSEP